MTFIPPILPKFSLEENVMVSVEGKTFPGVIKSLPFSQGGPYIVDCPSAHWPDFFYVSEEYITRPNLEQPVEAIETAFIERDPVQRKPIPSYSSYDAATSNIAAFTLVKFTMELASVEFRVVPSGSVPGCSAVPASVPWAAVAKSTVFDVAAVPSPSAVLVADGVVLMAAFTLPSVTTASAANVPSVTYDGS